MDILRLLPRELGCNLSLTQAGGDVEGGQVTTRAGRFAQTLVHSSLPTGVAPRSLGALGACSRVLAVVFTMGNKQTVFTHEQLEAYQVGVMGRALGGFGSLGLLAQEMGTASLHPGCAVSKCSGEALCVASGSDGRGLVGEEGGPPTPGRVWVKPTSLSAGLHLLHEEGNHEVSLGRREEEVETCYTLLDLQFDHVQCFIRVKALMGGLRAWLVDGCRDGKAEKSHLVLLSRL